MSFTFMVCEIDGEQWVCATDEKTGKPYLNHKTDPKSFISQFKDGVVFEVTSPGDKLLKHELDEAKKLLERAEKKLRFPGVFNVLAAEIESFLNK